MIRREKNLPLNILILNPKPPEKNTELYEVCPFTLTHVLESTEKAFIWMRTDNLKSVDIVLAVSATSILDFISTLGSS